MQLGDGPFCIFAFAKLDPIPDQEEHYEVERFCLVEPPGARNMCAVCGTGPMSHDGHDPDCGCHQEGDPGSEDMMKFADALSERAPLWALQGIAAWMFANPEQGQQLLLDRMLELELLVDDAESGGDQDHPTEKMTEMVREGRYEEVVEKILDGWRLTPHLEALTQADLDRDSEFSEIVAVLQEAFGDPPGADSAE